MAYPGVERTFCLSPHCGQLFWLHSLGWPHREPAAPTLGLGLPHVPVDSLDSLASSLVDAVCSLCSLWILSLGEQEQGPGPVNQQVVHQILFCFPEQLTPLQLENCGHSRADSVSWCWLTLAWGESWLHSLRPSEKFVYCSTDSWDDSDFGDCRGCRAVPSPSHGDDSDGTCPIHLDGNGHVYHYEQEWHKKRDLSSIQRSTIFTTFEESIGETASSKPILETLPLTWPFV